MANGFKQWRDFQRLSNRGPAAGPEAPAIEAVDAGRADLGASMDVGTPVVGAEAAEPAAELDVEAARDSLA